MNLPGPPTTSAWPTDGPREIDLPWQRTSYLPFGALSQMGQARPTCSALACLLPPRASIGPREVSIGQSIPFCLDCSIVRRDPQCMKVVFAAIIAAGLASPVGRNRLLRRFEAELPSMRVGRHVPCRRNQAIALYVCKRRLCSLRLAVGNFDVLRVDGNFEPG
jgi:hypothetical protein